MKIYKQWKGFLSGIIFTLAAAALTVTVFAAVKGTGITVCYDNIKILLNGREIDAKDVNGNDAEPFIYNGTTYVPIRAVSEACNKIVKWDADSKQVRIETDIYEFWANLIYTEVHEPDIYWRYIDDEIMEEADYFIAKYGANVLFQGLKSMNVYSQYYCINRLVEYYNDDAIRTRAITEITPFLKSSNNTIRHGAEFAVSVLSKKFDSPYIVKGADGVKLFALFNDYSDYGSYKDIWIIKNDKLSKFYSFPDTIGYVYIESIKISPDKDKIAVQTCTRKSTSFNVIDLTSKKISPELMNTALEKVAADNKDYNNTYSGGAYCFGGNLKWIDNNTIEFEADLAFDFMEIIEQVTVKYNVSDNSLKYTSR